MKQGDKGNRQGKNHGEANASKGYDQQNRNQKVVPN